MIQPASTRTFFYSIVFFFLGISPLHPAVAQDPLRFKDEVQKIEQSRKAANPRKVILFTGSSSIRLWSDLEKRFSDHNVLNTGFGGSQMSDLYYYFDELILPHKPSQIFIYEGDNDLGEGKSTEQILSDADKLLRRLRCELPKRTHIYFLTPKPSVLRWNLKEKYEDYMAELKKWCDQHKRVTFIDMWTPMLDENGQVRKDLLMDDNLHLNPKGYDIWEKIIAAHLK